MVTLHKYNIIYADPPWLYDHNFAGHPEMEIKKVM